MYIIFYAKMAHKPLFFLLIGYQRSELTWCWRVWSFGEYWGGGGGSENVWHASLPTKFFVEGPLFIEVMGVFFSTVHNVTCTCIQKFFYRNRVLNLPTTSVKSTKPAVLSLNSPSFWWLPRGSRWRK